MHVGSSLTSVVILMSHNHRLRAPPMAARGMTSDRCFDSLERRAGECLNWYYPDDALYHLHQPTSLGALWSCMDLRKFFFFKRLNRRVLQRILASVEVCASFCDRTGMHDRLTRLALYCWTSLFVSIELAESTSTVELSQRHKNCDDTLVIQ